MNRAPRSFVATLAFFLLLWNGQAAAEGLPDILGIRLGMPLKDARAQLQAQLPKNSLSERTDNLPTIDKPVVFSFNLEPPPPPPGGESDRVTVDVTMPPSDQVVWRVTRVHRFADKGIPKATLLASLREKYGKETSTNFYDKPAANDAEIRSLFWLLDEQGHPVALATVPGGNATITDCPGQVGDGSPGRIEGFVTVFKGRDARKDWCYDHYVAVFALVGANFTPDLYSEMDIEIVSLPMSARSALATAKWKKDLADQQHKQDLQKAGQQAAPKL